MCSNYRLQDTQINGENNSRIKSCKTEILICQKDGDVIPFSENPTDTELVSSGNPSAPQYFII